MSPVALSRRSRRSRFSSTGLDVLGRSMQQTEPLTDLQLQILTALVEGYKAREGMKDRIRALNEWEIARRAGLTEVSYAEFFEHPSREQALNALFALQRRSLAEVWERGVKYDTFIPTAKGESYLTSGEPGPVVDSGPQQALEPAPET